MTFRMIKRIISMIIFILVGTSLWSIEESYNFEEFKSKNIKYETRLNSYNTNEELIIIYTDYYNYLNLQLNTVVNKLNSMLPTDYRNVFSITQKKWLEYRDENNQFLLTIYNNNPENEYKIWSNKTILIKERIFLLYAFISDLSISLE